MEGERNMCDVYDDLQDSLRTLVLSSLNSFAVMMESAAHSTLDLAPDFTWTTSLCESPFRYGSTQAMLLDTEILKMHVHVP